MGQHAHPSACSSRGQQGQAEGREAISSAFASEEWILEQQESHYRRV
jgi:hypothetical protein